MKRSETLLLGLLPAAVFFITWAVLTAIAEIKADYQQTYSQVDYKGQAYIVRWTYIKGKGQNSAVDVWKIKRLGQPFKAPCILGSETNLIQLLLSGEAEEHKN